MQYSVSQLAETVFKFSLFVEKVGMSFNQFLVISDGKGALIETGFRQYFPLLRPELEKICPISEITKIFIPHFEGDEMGALGEFMAANAAIQVFATPLCAFSLGDLLGIEVAKVQDGQVVKHGRLKLRVIHVPQVHQWDAMVVLEEKTGILFSSDIFIQLGAGDGFVESDARSEIEVAIRKTKYLPSPAHLRSAIQKIEKEKIQIIAPMHGKCIRDEPGEYMKFLRGLEI